MLTFEFPDVGKADYFVARLQRERHEYTKSTSGKVVDVHLPASDDPSVAKITHDYLVVLAKHFGAYDLPKGPEPLFLLTIGRDETRIVTMAEFCRDNPKDEDYARVLVTGPANAWEVRRAATAERPAWRLERTHYVGRRA
jgi:hypothetical protein